MGVQQRVTSKSGEFNEPCVFMSNSMSRSYDSTLEPSDFPVTVTQAVALVPAARNTACIWVRYFKRPVDLLGAVMLLLVLSPLFLVIAILIPATSNGPVFFRQVRVGQHGRTFRIWKFRTMVSNAELVLVENPELGSAHQQTWKLRNDPRVTRVGAILRKTSLDELPQLLNVLRGDMSLIGPRPVQQKELADCFGDLAPLVLRARPGMTGLWQISGRSLLSYDERVRLDLQYVHTSSLKIDVLIALKTIPSILRGHGAV